MLKAIDSSASVPAASAQAVPTITDMQTDLNHLENGDIDASNNPLPGIDGLNRELYNVRVLGHAPNLAAMNADVANINNFISKFLSDASAGNFSSIQSTLQNVLMPAMQQIQGDLQTGNFSAAFEGVYDLSSTTDNIQRMISNP